MKLFGCQGIDKNGEEISEVVCQNDSFEYLKIFALTKCREHGYRDAFWMCVNSNWSWAQLAAGDNVFITLAHKYSLATNEISIA